MGYDAYVPCSCYQEGLTSAPPCPVVWNEAEGLFEPGPDVPDPGSRLWHKVFRWQDSACTHPRMRAVSLWIGNASAMAELRSAIVAIGSAEVPTLSQVLPVINGGMVEVERAAAVLRDIARFQELAPGVPCTALIDVRGGAPIFLAFPGESTPFMWTPDGNMGFDADGLYVERGGTELFRAKQVRLHRSSAQRCELEDVIGGALLRNAPCPNFGTTELRVQPVQLPKAHFEPIMTTLRTLFETSLALRRPVYWT